MVYFSAGVRSLRYPLLLSIVAHLFILLLWICLLDQRPPVYPQKTTLIELEPDQKKPLGKKKKELEKKQNRRIVQTSPADKALKSKPDSFLGWQNQTVDQQTVNRNKTIVSGADEHRPSNASPKSTQPQNLRRDLSKLGLSILPEMSQQKTEKDEPTWATPGTRPQDFVEGMKESDRTALNTREYLFYSYFQRIQSRLDQAWVPILREKLVAYYRSGRQLASDMDHTTKVLVILNDKGEIVRVQLVSESGTRDLDDAAVGAFNRAGPFPNPPKGMIDSNREVQIPWNFILKT